VSTKNREGFDGAAAVTRSLLGWGVVAGPFYLMVGTALALTRDGFDLTQHQLSLLMLGDGGWMQRANLILSGVMTIAAAIGFHRASRGSKADRTGTLVLVCGLGLIGSGIFAPDPMRGFPAGAPEQVTFSGIMHMTFGLIQFVALAAAAIVAARWFARRGSGDTATYSRISAAVIIAGFAGGAALSTTGAGVALLWLAVVAGWAWLLVASISAYRTVPHPDAHRRVAVTA